MMNVYSRLRKFLSQADRTVLLLGAFVLAGILLMVQHVARLQRELVETNALQGAELYSKALANFRILYTSDVVSRLKEQGIQVRHDYNEVPGSIPLPATLSMELGRKLGTDSGVKTRLYSPHPFPWRKDGGLRDDFERAAWENLSLEPAKPFFRIEEVDGKKVLRYATADILRKSCVNCHNTHASTPKSDWQAGDLRGVLEVSYPMDSADLVAGAGVRDTALIMAILAGLSLLGFQVSAKKIQQTSFEIAEQKAQEQIRIEAEARAHQTQKLEAIGVLAGGIAHEINTPIQYVSANTRFLAHAFEDLNPVLDSFDKLIDDSSNSEEHQEELEKARELSEEADVEFLTEEIPEAISQSLEGLERVAGIVRSMKEFSHMGLGEYTPVDINRLLESSARMCGSEWKYVAELTTNLCPELPPLMADRSRLSQVFVNLLINASHALQEQFETRKEKGALILSTASKNNGVEVRVQDTGGGIPKEVQSRILEPFFTTKKVGHGTGQGLSICLSAVQKHSGTINFETGPEGTCFIVWLPYSPDEEESAQLNSQEQNLLKDSGS